MSESLRPERCGGIHPQFSGCRRVRVRCRRSRKLRDREVRLVSRFRHPLDPRLSSGNGPFLDQRCCCTNLRPLARTRRPWRCGCAQSEEWGSDRTGLDQIKQIIARLIRNFSTILKLKTCTLRRETLESSSSSIPRRTSTADAAVTSRSPQIRACVVRERH